MNDHVYIDSIIKSMETRVLEPREGSKREPTYAAFSSDHTLSYHMVYRDTTLSLLKIEFLFTSCIMKYF